MQLQLLFFAIVPVVAFMAVRSRGGLKRAVGTAVIVATFEFAYNSFRFGAVERFSLVSLLFFVVFGAIAVRRNEEWIFELQPVALDGFLAAAFLYSWHVLEIPLLTVVLMEHVRIGEIFPAYQQGYVAVYATTLSRSLPYLLLVHAAITAYAALRRSIWWWFHVRVFLFYALVAALFFAERIFDVKP